MRAATCLLVLATLGFAGPKATYRDEVHPRSPETPLEIKFTPWYCTKCVQEGRCEPSNKKHIMWKMPLEELVKYLELHKKWIFIETPHFKIVSTIERAKVKLSTVEAGDLDYPGSPIASWLYLRQEQAFDLTRPGVDDQPTWLAGARDIVVNVSHPLVESALDLAAKEPFLGAQLIAQAICIREGVNERRAVELASTAMNRRNAR